MSIFPNLSTACLTALLIAFGSRTSSAIGMHERPVAVERRLEASDTRASLRLQMMLSAPEQQHLVTRSYFATIKEAASTVYHVA